MASERNYLAPRTEEEFAASEAFWRQFFGGVVRELEAERFWRESYSSEDWDRRSALERLLPIEDRDSFEAYAPHLGRAIQLREFDLAPHNRRIACWTKDMAPLVEGVATEVLLFVWAVPTERILRRLSRVMMRFMDPAVPQDEALQALDALQRPDGETRLSQPSRLGMSAAETGVIPDEPGIDERREICARRWKVKCGADLEGGSVAAVCESRSARGEDLVLKLSPLWAHPAEEAAALRVWRGRGAARVVDFAEDISALLLERVRPGTCLLERDRAATRLPGSDARAIAAASDALIKMRRAEVPDEIFPSFAEVLRWWVARARLYGEREAEGTAMLPTLERLAMALHASAELNTLAHGDFIAKNLLLGPDGGYVAVDPQPFIGDPCSDIGQFSAYHSPVATVIDRAHAIANATGDDADRAARWAAIWMVFQACETWREDSDEVQAWVRGEECQRLLSSIAE